METIKIKRLSFDSYVEICAVIGLLTGIVSSVVGLIIMGFNLVGFSDLEVGAMFSQILLTPIFSGIGGIFTGLFTFYPYKIYMKLRKGTELNIVSK